MDRILDDFPNPEANFFVMMRFRDSAQHSAIERAIADVLREYSLNMLRADQKQYHNELWTNVRAYLDACNYGIAVFEQIDEPDINPNVSLELGYMFGQDKRCLLLKEKRVDALNSDLLGLLYCPFDSYKIEETVPAQVRRWLKDIGIAKTPDERLVVFVSHGGTCRCAMAKAITRVLLKRDPPPFRIRVESAAYGEPDLPKASNGARLSIKKLLGEDLLASHRTMRLTKTLQSEADLLLVMSDDLRKGLPTKKTRLLKDFFLGTRGGIEDPYLQSGKWDAAVLRKYDECAHELEKILEGNLYKLVATLE